MSERLRRARALLGHERSAPRAGRTGTRAPQHASRLPFGVLVTALLLGGLGLLLVLNTASAANELRRHGLASRDSGIAAQVEQLRNQVAASAAPANLADAAGALGMVPANKPAFVVVGPDGSIRVLGKAGPANAPVLRAPHPKATPTPTPSKTSATPTATKSSTAAKSTAPRGRHAKPSPTPSATAPKPMLKSTPKPTPTPTPTVTLPGGPR